MFSVNYKNVERDAAECTSTQLKLSGRLDATLKVKTDLQKSYKEFS